jgi:uncharacterized integral membrane protein
VRDKILIALVVLVIILNLGHTVDHFVRGDFRWPLTVATVPPFLVTLAINAILGFGLYFYLKNKLGPLFWAIVAGTGVAFGWLAHFSPFTEQTPQYIYRAYETPALGWLAVAWLAALMLVLIGTAIYAEYLWARRLK